MLVKSTILYEALLVTEDNFEEALLWGVLEPSAGTLVGKAIVRNGQMIVAILDIEAFLAQYEEIPEEIIEEAPEVPDEKIEEVPEVSIQDTSP